MVTLEIEGAVATITLARPDVGNAIDLPMAHRLLEVIGQCAGDDAVRCVILAGSGRMFCVGGDVAAMSAAEEGCAEFLDELIGAFHTALLALMSMNKPLVTLVGGPAAGAGLSLAIAGDAVLAARSASFVAAYGAVGLTADGGMSWLLPRLVGLRAAQRMILLGEPVAAEEAARIGLATRLVEDADLAAEGHRLARRLASGSLAAFAGARALLAETFDTPFAEQLAKERASMVAAARTPECAEGIAAFLERRKPNFLKGRE